jgi:hypothetical protein
MRDLLFALVWHPQIGATFLGLFVMCMVTLVPINWILYNQIYQDLK